MTGTRRYRHRSTLRPSRLGENRYVRIVGIIVMIVVVASFYIYQRVWVRNLVEEVQRMQKRNEEARQDMAVIRSQWMTASAIANIEPRVNDMKLGLVPTRPSQNFTLSPAPDLESSRYSGLAKAFEKLTNNIPLVSSNNADAEELFDSK